MKSIKPGRGPSAIGALGSIIAGVFGVIWIFAAASIGAPSFFVLFGILFVVVAIVQGLFHFKNATSRNRMSLFDITDDHKEPDPLNQWSSPPNYSNNHSSEQSGITGNINFCSYCGDHIVDESYVFCTKCGKQIRTN